MAALDSHAPPLGPAGEPCTSCAAPLAADQRYCLECGARRGPARLDPLAMARGTWTRPSAPPAPRVTAPRRARGTPWAMPAPRAAGAAALAVLAFGIVAGTVAGPRADATLASATPAPIVVVGPPTAAAPPPATPSAATTAPSPEPDVVPAPAADLPSTNAPVVATESAPAAPAAPVTSPPTEPAPADTPSTPAPAVPPVKHVWVVALTEHSLDEVAADTGQMPYLWNTLKPKGLTVPKWQAASVGSLANLVVLASGQQPTDEQKSGCATYADTACVLPPKVETLPGQLTAAGRTWRGYVEGSDIGSDPPNGCRHPALGQPDPWALPRGGDAYLTQRNPFVYFHSIIDTPDCGANIATVSRLVPDAQDADSAPNYSLVVPDACHDGRDRPCAEGAPAGLSAADEWLKAQIEPVLTSKAYADDGLIVVTFDHGLDPLKQVGAVLLSPHIKADTVDQTPYTHTGLLKTIEDAFSVDRLGKARSDSVKTLGDDVFSITTPSR